MTSRVSPAITPDVRTIYNQRTKGNTNKNSTSGWASSAAASSSIKVVSFGLSQKESAAATKDDILFTKEEAIRQYKLYRSNPTLFPSYDRIKLVKLPGTYLPASLLRSAPHGSDSNIITTATIKNVYWPAIIYHNLVEVVRDLSPNETPLLKAQLIVEYKKDPRRKVARLIGWNYNGIFDDNSCNDKDVNMDVILFAESKLELLRLPPFINNNTAVESDETKNFCESLTEMEKTYCHLLNLAKKEENNGNTKEFAIRFGYALDMALNCLTMDVGSEPLLPRVYEECYPRQKENQEIQHEQKKKEAKNNHTLDECKPPSATATANDGVNINAVSIYGENNKHSPAEDSMFSTAAVIDRDDYQHTSVVSGQRHKSTKSSVSIGTKRKKTTAAQFDTNSGAMPMTKKTQKPAAPVAGRSKPPKSSTNLDKVRTEEKNVAAPTTTKSIKEKAGTEIATTKVIIPWKDLWATMKRCGWSWKGGSGLMTDYYYIKPKCKITGGVSGIDYFVTVGDTSEFAHRTYGWDAYGMTSCTREKLFLIIEEHAKYAGEVVPPLTAEMTLNPNGPWTDAWKVMLRSGWTWRPGSGLMMDYYYIKPGCKVGGGVEGQDYFIRVKDVQQFARRNYGWRVNNGCGQGGDGDVEAKNFGATRAQTHRLSSSNDNRGDTDDVPAGKRPQHESKKVPANKDGVEDATKSIKPAKAKSQEPIKDADDYSSSSSSSSSSLLLSSRPVEHSPNVYVELKLSSDKTFEYQHHQSSSLPPSQRNDEKSTTPVSPTGSNADGEVSSTPTTPTDDVDTSTISDSAVDSFNDGSDNIADVNIEEGVDAFGSLSVSSGGGDNEVKNENDNVGQTINNDGKSAYELLRDEKIARNNARLKELGFLTTKQPRMPQKRVLKPKPVLPARRSRRVDEVVTDL